MYQSSLVCRCCSCYVHRQLYRWFYDLWALLCPGVLRCCYVRAQPAVPSVRRCEAFLETLRNLKKPYRSNPKNLKPKRQNQKIIKAPNIEPYYRSLRNPAPSGQCCGQSAQGVADAPVQGLRFDICGGSEHRASIIRIGSL